MAIAFYKDLPLDFTPHPVSGDIRPITNETAIKRALKNLILTRKGSKPFRPEYGTDIGSYLFNNIDRFTKNDIQKSLAESISKFETRINLREIEISSDDGGLNLVINFSIKNTGQKSTLNLTVKRTA